MGSKYDDNTIYEIARRISTGEISYSEAQREYGVKSQGSIGVWIRKYEKGLLPFLDMGQYSELSREELVEKLKEMDMKLQHSNLQTKAFEALIEVAEEKFQIDIRKKPGTKQSFGSKKEK